ncbi:MULTISPECIES: site-specific integrase [Rhodococcus]|uniref:site-specific integrase n=1 Tax=Rhodococcus TaxID=1827 RepID=UPI001E30F4DA|nr:site-specific integrase [Rhodococcus pyridinivorans]MCD2119438.1 site-specific integrase [Rhodococcus pyridinivorans]MCZ4628339.1 site-specific integrase [Rhodococcus pyridinivorans]MCZ4649604.1 site-specific integrase [Rhodococcus pyridinivorans]MDJ0483686.1 site-specific integrase [Rhodococcus pyridinivorans]MDV7255663.1 site-specific integrase [Rhodococcus pyridinivorans]
MSTSQHRTRRAEPISKRVHADGTTVYEFRVDVGTRADGTRDRRRHTFPTLRAARAEYRRITTEVAAGTHIAPSRTTVAEACDAWLAGKRDVRDVTRRGYEYALVHAVRHLGGLHLQAVTKAHLDELVTHMLSGGSRRGTPLSVRQVQFTVRTLRAVFEDARRQGQIARNVVELVEMPRATPHTMQTWTRQETARFRQHITDERLAACWLLTLSGFRRSEVLGLNWSTVDFEHGTVAVVASRVPVGSGKDTQTGAPKSARGRRVLTVHPSVLAALRALRATQAAEKLALGTCYPDSGLVAVHEDGRPIRPEWYSDEFRRLCESAGVRPIRLHDVRHTSVTLQLDAGHPIAAVAAWHGHSAEEMLRTYAHAVQESLTSAGATLFEDSPDAV